MCNIIFCNNKGSLPSACKFANFSLRTLRSWLISCSFCGFFCCSATILAPFSYIYRRFLYADSLVSASSCYYTKSIISIFQGSRIAFIIFESQGSHIAIQFPLVFQHQQSDLLSHRSMRHQPETHWKSYHQECLPP